MTAADQPTTEPRDERHERVIAAMNGVSWEHWLLWSTEYPETQRRHREVSSERAWQILAAVDALLAPAPQPAADTETEVQWGVRTPSGGVLDYADQDEAIEAQEVLGEGFTVIHCTATTTRTPWEEA